VGAAEVMAPETVPATAATDPRTGRGKVPETEPIQTVP